MKETTSASAVEYDLDFSLPAALVEANPEGQFPRQKPVYLYIDLTADQVRVFAEPRNYDLSARSPEEYLGHIIPIELPNEVDAHTLGDWVREELGELIAKVAGGYKRVWFQGNYCAFFDVAATEAIKEIEHLTEDFDGPTIDQEPSGLWDLSEWLDSSVYGPGQGRANAEIEGIGRITPHTTEEHLVEMARAIQAEAAENNVVLDGDPLAYVTGLRRECREIAFA